MIEHPDTTPLCPIGTTRRLVGVTPTTHNRIIIRFQPRPNPDQTPPLLHRQPTPNPMRGINTQRIRKTRCPHQTRPAHPPGLVSGDVLPCWEKQLRARPAQGMPLPHERFLIHAAPDAVVCQKRTDTTVCDPTRARSPFGYLTGTASGTLKPMIFHTRALRWATTLTLTALTLTGCDYTNHPTVDTPPPTTAQSIHPTPTTNPTHITWAYTDTAGINTTGGGGNALNPMNGLVIPGLVTDLLYRRRNNPGSIPDTKTTAALAGNPDAAWWYATQDDGINPAMTRIAADCNLSIKTSPPRATALDIAQYGACLREYGIADPGITNTVLTALRRNTGGITDAVTDTGGKPVAEFNTTTLTTPSRATTACLAISTHWAAVVIVDYDTTHPGDYGLQQCAHTATTDFPADDDPQSFGPATPDINASTGAGESSPTPVLGE